MTTVDRSTTTVPSPRAADSRWPAPLQVIVAVAAMFIASFLPNLLVAVPPLARWMVRQHPPGSWLLESVVLLLPLLVAVPIVALLTRLDNLTGRRRLGTIGWRWDRRGPLGLGIGLGCGIVVMVGCAALLQTLGLLRPVSPDSSSDVPPWIVLIMVLLRGFTLQAIPEELIFRGYLLSSLRLSAFPAIMISATSFAVLHLISTGGQQGPIERVLYLTMPFGFAVLAGVLRVVLDSLPAAIGVHGGLHLGYAVCVMLGLGDGPWLWVSAGALWAVIGLVLTTVRARRVG